MSLNSFSTRIASEQFTKNVRRVVSEITFVVDIINRHDVTQEDSLLEPDVCGWTRAPRCPGSRRHPAASGLQGRLTNRSRFSPEHRDEGVTYDVMRKSEIAEYSRMQGFGGFLVNGLFAHAV